MSEQQPSRISGAFHKGVGKVEETFGSLTGNEERRQAGIEKQQQGARETTAAQAQTTVEGWKNESEGKMKQEVGQKSGDQGLKSEGIVKETLGKTQQL